MSYQHNELNSPSAADGSVIDTVAHVQVEHYPPLYFLRTSDGGWRMENVNAIMLER